MIKPTAKNYLKVTLVTLGISYAIVISFFYFMQSTLIFPGELMPEGRLAQVSSKYPHATEVNVETTDGASLKGWLLDKDKAASSPLVIFFTGNSEEVSEFMPHAAKYLEGWALLMVNYRGFGLSKGVPGQDELFKDAELLYDKFSNSPGIDSDRIVLLGRSLGTGVAVHLASVRPVDGVVLISPYESITKAAKYKHPYMPISLLIKHPFDSASKVPAITVPLLAIESTNDIVIPVEQTRAIVKLWGGPSELVTVISEDHDSVAFEPVLWERVTKFINELPKR